MRILIADDEPSLRETLEYLLTKKGHEVVSAKNGVEALYIYMHEERPFDYVITDYQMPGKNGVVLIMDIRKANPSQKIIMVSGDPPTLPDHVRKETGEFSMLQKPYRNAQLLDLLK